MRKPITGFERYEITEDGRVWSTYYHLWLNPDIAHNGYLRVRLYHKEGSKKFAVHVLVAKHFLENTENKPEVNHIDGNKTNNNVFNLEWVTGSENQLHAFKSGLHERTREASKRNMKLVQKWVMANQAKVVLQYDLNGNFIAEHLSTGKAAIATGAQQTKISSVALGKRRTAGGFMWLYKTY